MLLAVMLFLLVTTLATSQLVVSHATQSRRDKEAELLFVGDQYRRAIASYYNTLPPGGVRTLPQSLDALLVDQRFPQPIHHLRRLYPDPMTGKPDWQLVRSTAGIAGVHSRSDHLPLKRVGFPALYPHFADREHYSDWTFAVR
jgi:type II secretory pathway pseudopilin PulG